MNGLAVDVEERDVLDIGVKLIVPVVAAIVVPVDTVLEMLVNLKGMVPITVDVVSTVVLLLVKLFVEVELLIVVDDVGFPVVVLLVIRIGVLPEPIDVEIVG